MITKTFRRNSMNLTEGIYRLISYGLDTALIEDKDISYCKNRFFELFGIGGPESGFEVFKKTFENSDSLEEIVDFLCDIAYEKVLIKQNTVAFRDIFDAKIMDILMPRPSEVQRLFWEKYAVSPKVATDYYYRQSRDSNYIKTYRVKKDISWKHKTEFGDLDITINLSKPEKDPRDIALAKNEKKAAYPRCLLCPENEGYAGRLDHPARNNIRLIPLVLDGEEWFLQYSPYVYYNEHCIVLNSAHTPMTINASTFKKLLDFLDIFPHYIIGSNADLPIVGGSILAHEHFQGGSYTFALNKAPFLKEFFVKGFDDVRSGIVKWPMSVIRLVSKNRNSITLLASHILSVWKNYTDKESFVFSETDGIPHNTITPIASVGGDGYVLDLVLRNNITTEEHPLGVYHPHKELHHIKKENIGLIEVMGLAILPSRLKSEMEKVKSSILEGIDVETVPEIKAHSEWVKNFLPKYKKSDLSPENIDGILKAEIGNVFLKVLWDAGVYKQTEEGIRGFERFLNVL